MADWDDVRSIALALPGAEETTSRGLMWWRAGPMFVAERPLRKKEVLELGPMDEPILVARLESEDEKFALLAEDPDVFFTVSHYDGYAMVLVRLERISRERLAELIESAWATAAPASEVTRHLGGG